MYSMTWDGTSIIDIRSRPVVTQKVYSIFLGRLQFFYVINLTVQVRQSVVFNERFGLANIGVIVSKLLVALNTCVKNKSFPEEVYLLTSVEVFRCILIKGFVKCFESNS